MLAEGKYASLSLIDDAMPIVVQTVWTPQFAAWGKGIQKTAHGLGRERNHSCFMPVLKHRWQKMLTHLDSHVIYCKECKMRWGLECRPGCGAANLEAHYRELKSLAMALKGCLCRDQVLMKIQERKGKRIEEEADEAPLSCECKTLDALEDAPIEAALEWEVHLFGMPLDIPLMPL